MAEKLHSPEASETSGPVAREIGWVRWAANGVVNGLNDGAEFAGTATAYTLGRTGRTVKEAAKNLMKGGQGERYGLAA